MRLAASPSCSMANFVRLLRGGNETWVLNDVISNEIVLFNDNINFISNGEHFNSLSVVEVFPQAYSLRYGDVEVAAIFSDDNTNWEKQAFRTITFLEPPTGELLTWLQANGVKQ